jgi:hypothetical protein
MGMKVGKGPFIKDVLPPPNEVAFPIASQLLICFLLLAAALADQEPGNGTLWDGTAGPEDERSIVFHHRSNLSHSRVDRAYELANARAMPKLGC